MRLFIFGTGFSSKAFVEEVRDQFDWIGGTTRSSDKMEALRTLGVEPFLFDGNSQGDNIAEALKQATHILVSIAPNEAGDPVLNQYANEIAGAKPRWIGYLSTVGVYGNHDGAWVDEETPLNPVSKRSVQRVAAEEAWLAFAEQNDLPVQIFRLSGIYGPGRNAFENFRKGTARRLVKPGQVFNRIHVADIAGALKAAMAKPSTRVFNVTDDEPAPPQDVVAFAAELLGVEAPPEIPFETADLTPMARSFYGENKRVSNQRLKDELGFTFRYPDYRVALKALLETV
ncbi:NAD dependent epimerase/dehydratase family protein [Labrenzia sp. THAF191b]|uniref:SDR family oxidoreductase n=1 Tax=unclassified Labrenzia TaxID=2648686 RepID=UPI00126880C6|nr:MULTISPECIES: SDR family NAD(P)-dependent oxidoreductase [unclassified Labrenzia]QFS96261.1 NAD dependent epimerase/dehydratase family protein [Labrenzia sp. THAF191b]QFT02576.1 NAD dependent epimerase/dehydratase family protein [Labrenzia sp. THAF191a]QFT14118.1 NAD dependent epimerase/dehydratase family protein [Labrenzia sp. THAF187b]